MVVVPTFMLFVKSSIWREQDQKHMKSNLSILFPQFRLALQTDLLSFKFTESIPLQFKAGWRINLMLSQI